MDADVTVEELRVRIRWKTRQMRIVCLLWGEGDAPKLPMPCIRVRDLSAVNDLVRRTDCDAVLFLRAGEVYHQLSRGEESQEAMFARISDTLTVLAQGGEVHA